MLFAPLKLTAWTKTCPFDDSHATIIFELILYYAWGVDIEDQANRERSNAHWANALEVDGY